MTSLFFRQAPVQELDGRKYPRLQACYINIFKKRLLKYFEKTNIKKEQVLKRRIN